MVEPDADGGETRRWKAGELLREGSEDPEPVPTAASHDDGSRCGHGKIILFGEHAVVYGMRAIAAPVPLAVTARIEAAEKGVWIVMSRWGVEHRLHDDPGQRSTIEAIVASILEGMGLLGRNMLIEIRSQIPRAMGLGGSAAVAVAIIRALGHHFGLGLTDGEVNRFAFRAEKVAHGTPSGIDNTVATYGRPIVFRAGALPQAKEISIDQPLRFVVGITGSESLTARTVARVRTARQQNAAAIDRVLDGIDAVTGKALAAIRKHDLDRLGHLMNRCHDLLKRLQVSSWELEELVEIARRNGALGAKLTGGGGGGSMIALCPEGASRVIEAMGAAGYRAYEVSIA